MHTPQINMDMSAAHSPPSFGKPSFASECAWSSAKCCQASSLLTRASPSNTPGILRRGLENVSQTPYSHRSCAAPCWPIPPG